MLSGICLCDGPITRPEESCRVRVCECDLETSPTRRQRPTTVVASWEGGRARGGG